MARPEGTFRTGHLGAAKLCFCVSWTLSAHCFLHWPVLKPRHLLCGLLPLSVFVLPFTWVLLCGLPFPGHSMLVPFVPGPLATGSHLSLPPPRASAIDGARPKVGATTGPMASVERARAAEAARMSSRCFMIRLLWLIGARNPHERA